MQSIEARTGIGGDEFDAELLDHVHHVVRSGMLNDPDARGRTGGVFLCRLGWIWSSPASAAAPSSPGLGTVSLLRSYDAGWRDERCRARGRAFQKSATANGSLPGFPHRFILCVWNWRSS
jgi:hypothetical protein